MQTISAVSSNVAVRGDSSAVHVYWFKCLPNGTRITLVPISMEQITKYYIDSL